MLRECISWFSVSIIFTHMFFSMWWSRPWLSLALFLHIKPRTEKTLVRVQHGVELHTFPSLSFGIPWSPRITSQVDWPITQQTIVRCPMGLPLHTAVHPCYSLHWQPLQSQETICMCSFLLNAASKEIKHLVQGGRWCCLKCINALLFKILSCL